MKLKYFWLLLSPLLSISILSCAMGGTYPIYLRYKPVKEFSSLKQRLGSSLGIAPFQDKRSDTLYIGHHSSLRGGSNYFKTEPFPLENAIKESLNQFISRYGVKMIPVKDWDGKPESLKKMEIDSILMIEIKRFWTEGRTVAFRTNVNTSIYLIIHLGVKKEGKVFTRNVYVGKEMKVARLTPERVEATINQILTEIFDNFFSNPYQI